MPQRGEILRIKLLISSVDDPVLYRELSQLAKGARRTNRVRALLTRAMVDEASALGGAERKPGRSRQRPLPDGFLESLDFDPDS